MTPAQSPAPPPPVAPVAHLEAKATALLLLLLLLVCGAVGYLMYARGVFEATQRLVLLADESEGVTVGMDLSFSGFAIGRVRRIELGADGNARIVVDVPRKDAHWLRSTSVFTLSRGLVGNTSLRAYSGVLTDPPLPDGAERKVLTGDASAEIPRLVTVARELLQNLTAMSAPDSPLGTSLRNVQTATARLNGPRGALGLVFGNDADARKLVAAIERSNALLARMDALVARADAIAAKADAQVLGPGGVMSEARDAAARLGVLLGEARTTLTRVDTVLEQATAIAADTRSATADLGVLRAEVEASLRKVQHLLDEVNRKWPFARDTELKLP